MPSSQNSFRVIEQAMHLPTIFFTKNTVLNSHIFTRTYSRSSNAIHSFTHPCSQHIHLLLLIWKTIQNHACLSQLRPCLTYFLPRKSFLSLFVCKFICILVNKQVITILVIRVTFHDHTNALVLSYDTSLIN